MPSKYTLEWLDTVVAVNLNHLKCDLPALSDSYLASVIDGTPAEAAKVMSAIKEQAFGLSKERQVEVLVRQYHTALISLYDTALENSQAFEARGGLLAEACIGLTNAVCELLTFVEKRYQRFLSLDEILPHNYMLAASAELSARMEKLASSFESKTCDPRLAEAIVNALAIQAGHQPITFSELLYRKEILRQLEELDTLQERCDAKTINEFLVYMNFNSNIYVTYLTQVLSARLEEKTCHADKLDLLLLAMKEFNQTHHREGVRLNTHDADLKTTIGNWFLQELDYLERRERMLANPENNAQRVEVAGSKTPKLMCSLSVDQIALLIRSADEAKILVCRSVNAVFKTLAPFLSTDGRRDISPDSMRSKSYSAERRDKEVVIARLQEMIAMIRNY